MTGRYDPGLADHTRSVWRRRHIVVLGLLAGFALGLLVLPKVGSQPSYRATVRIDVQPLASTVLGPPSVTGGNDTARTNGTTPASPLQDVNVASTVLRELGPDARRLSAVAGQPRAQQPGALAAAITPSSVPGSSQFDLSYTDRDPRLAARTVQAYADAYARRRNASDAALTKQALDAMQQQLDRTNARITALSAQADRETDPFLHRSPSTATSTQLRLATDEWHAQAQALDNVRRQLLFLGPRTSVLAAPVVARADQAISKSLYLSLGLLLGLAAGIGAALLADAARPKVVTLADLESATRLEPVGAVPSGGVRRRRRLAVAAFPYSPAAEGYRRVAAELLRRGVANEIKVLAVVSPDRREGRSTMTANLAYALANEGRRVAVISGDLRRPAAEDIFHIARSDGLAELLEGDDRDPVTKLWSVTSRLVVMPAGSPNRNPADLLASPTLRRFMSSMRELDWLILIDTPPARSLADALILAGVADAVLLVARSGVSRARALEATAAGLDRANHRMVGAALVDVTPGVLARRNLRRPGRGGGGDGYPVPKAPLYDGTLESRWQDEERKVLGASSSKDESA